MKIEAGRFIGKILDRKEDDYEKRINQVFSLRYKEMICEYDDSKTGNGLDCDEYDKYCDHAVVIDTTTDEVIGTYRFILENHIKNLNGKFLLEKEFNIDVLKDRKLMEVGRAVVSKKHRDGSVILLLWKEAIRYALEKKVDIMLGTASFHGIDGSKYSDCMRYITNNYMSNEKCYAINDVYKINDNNEEIDMGKVRSEMPPLIKGYIRIGSSFGRDAFIDRDFCSTDMLVITKIKDIKPQYLNKFAK